jgi:hypothetical protein
MDEQMRDELLIRLDERVDKIREDQKSLTATITGKGFARCQVHDDKLAKIESTVTWSRRGIIGTALALAGKFIYGLIVPTS